MHQPLQQRPGEQKGHQSERGDLAVEGDTSEEQQSREEVPSQGPSPLRLVVSGVQQALGGLAGAEASGGGVGVWPTSGGGLHMWHDGVVPVHAERGHGPRDVHQYGVSHDGERGGEHEGVVDPNLLGAKRGDGAG